MIVVTTPTGRIGLQLLNKLFNSNAKVRVIARDPDRLIRLAPYVEGWADIVEGSHSDPDVVMDAFAGADSVFWLVPPNRQEKNNVVNYYRDFTSPACEAIKIQGVKRVVGVSSLGQDHPRAKGAGLLTALFKMDKLIEDTGVNYRALRVPFLMDDLDDQVEAIKQHRAFKLANAEDSKLAMVATSDVAAAAVEQLTGSWEGKESVPVVGPDVLSPRGMKEVMSQVLGEPVN